MSHIQSSTLSRACSLFCATLLISFGLPAMAWTANAEEAPKYAGALTFSADGVLFVGDNVSSAIHAYSTQNSGSPTATSPTPLDIDAIDVRVARLLHVPREQLEFNGLAVDPLNHDVFLSASAGRGAQMRPAVVRVSTAGNLSRFDLGVAHERYLIQDPPSLDSKFRNRTGDWPVPGPAKYAAKAQTPMRSMTIVDMKVHNGELYISGISNEEFASTLRRVKYPFDGNASETQVRIYHVAHERYETRAPIRAMTFATIDGQDTLVAGYTCSPLVLIPVAELKNGAKVTGRTIGDMGNGQPLSMFPVKLYGQDTIFVTNAGHGPRMMPVAALQKAVVYLPDNSPKNYPSDLSPEYPLGPVGKSVMFVGASLMADRLDDKFLVSLTRNARSGALELEALPISPLPMKLDQIWSEFDFAGGGPQAAK